MSRKWAVVGVGVLAAVALGALVGLDPWIGLGVTAGAALFLWGLAAPRTAIVGAIVLSIVQYAPIRVVPVLPSLAVLVDEAVVLGSRFA